MHQTLGTTFTVRAGEHEGPLELLLDLIEKHKLLVSDLSLSQVTDDFTAYIKNGTSFPTEDTANFIATAATLLLIKSRSLLPELELTGEEEEDIEDLRRRLVAYEKARDAARELSRMFGREVMMAAGERKAEPTFAPTKDLSLDRLASALADALAAQEVPEEIGEARVKPIISLEAIMELLQGRMERALSLSFAEFTGATAEKLEVIVSFLALLELVKQGSLDAEQQGTFTDITIMSTRASMPRYES